MSSYY